jgi:hypothetical protein
LWRPKDRSKWDLDGEEECDHENCPRPLRFEVRSAASQKLIPPGVSCRAHTIARFDTIMLHYVNRIPE